MNRFSLIGLLVSAGTLCSAAAQADYFSPNDFSSGGAFPASSITIDTSLLTVDDNPWPGVSVETQAAGPDVAVFTFDGDAFVPGDITLTGSLPAVILFKGPVTITGSWSVNTARTEDGPGDGRNASNGGGGGGGFGGNGGVGANGGGGGSSYGDLFSALEAGSGGGGVLGETGDTVLGGGAVEVGALGLLFLNQASINADGSPGFTQFSKGTGGGSGGGIFLHAFDVSVVEATVVARGGQGGRGTGEFPSGGGGGGGHIAILSNTGGAAFVSGSAVSVAGGPKGSGTGVGNATAGATGSYLIEMNTQVGLPEPGRDALVAAAFATLAVLRRRNIG